jgi:hypothetical protein
MQSNITIRLHSPDATNVTFIPASDHFVTPIPKGVALGTLSIEPAGWGGDISMSGDDAGLFAVNDKLELVAAQDLTEPREYHLTASATS